MEKGQNNTLSWYFQFLILTQKHIRKRAMAYKSNTWVFLNHLNVHQLFSKHLNVHFQFKIPKNWIFINFLSFCFFFTILSLKYVRKQAIHLLKWLINDIFMYFTVKPLLFGKNLVHRHVHRIIQFYSKLICIIFHSLYWQH